MAGIAGTKFFAAPWRPLAGLERDRKDIIAFSKLYQLRATRVEEQFDELLADGGNG